MYGAVFAGLYNLSFTWAERRGLARLRHEVLSTATGRTVELGAGTGLNLTHYPATVTELVLTEPDPHMAAKLRAAVRRAEVRAEVIEAPAEKLPFPDQSVETVVSTLVLCTVPLPAAALAEVARVLRPNGKFLFIEHVRSQNARLGRWQDRLRGPWSVFARGCQCNRDTLATISKSPLVLDRSRPDRLTGLPPVVRPLVVGMAVRP